MKDGFRAGDVDSSSPTLFAGERDCGFNREAVQPVLRRLMALGTCSAWARTLGSRTCISIEGDRTLKFDRKAPKSPSRSQLRRAFQ